MFLSPLLAKLSPASKDRARVVYDYRTANNSIMMTVRKVFLSWSGDRSKAVAEGLGAFAIDLTQLLQGAPAIQLLGISFGVVV